MKTAMLLVVALIAAGCFRPVEGEVVSVNYGSGYYASGPGVIIVGKVVIPDNVYHPPHYDVEIRTTTGETRWVEVSLKFGRGLKVGQRVRVEYDKVKVIEVKE